MLAFRAAWERAGTANTSRLANLFKVIGVLTVPPGALLANHILTERQRQIDEMNRRLLEINAELAEVRRERDAYTKRFMELKDRD